MTAELCAAECVEHIAISCFGRPHLGSFRAIKNFRGHIACATQAWEGGS